ARRTLRRQERLLARGDERSQITRVMNGFGRSRPTPVAYRLEGGDLSDRPMVNCPLFDHSRITVRSRLPNRGAHRGMCCAVRVALAPSKRARSTPTLGMHAPGLKRRLHRLSLEESSPDSHMAAAARAEDKTTKAIARRISWENRLGATCCRFGRHSQIHF
uniref:Uncharacterized protein n=1 Tax=Plectus sambesii TaxID=2011161 RepID=A0A914XGW4_9BILA